jgi:hypothetical protein
MIIGMMVCGGNPPVLYSAVFNNNKIAAGDTVS